MDGSTKQSCRLCMEEPPPCELENIDAKRKEMLGILLIKINFNKSNYDVACKRCLKRLQDSFDFKTHCIATVMEAGNKTDDEKVFPMEIMSSTENENICLDLQVCCLCLSSFIQDKDLKEVGDLSTGVLLNDMIRNCLPEMDLNAIRESLICKSCLNSLKEFCKFMDDCLMVERLCHSAHQSTADMPNEEWLKTKIKSEDCDEFGKPAIVKEESYTDAENEVNPVMYPKNEDIASIKCEELHIKKEVDIGEEMRDSIPLEACNNSVKSCSLKRKQISASKASNRFSSEHHIASHKGLTKVFDVLEMHKCELSPYKTKYKTGILNDQLSHKSEDMLHQHTHNLIHNNRSDVKMHKCDNCEYKTRRKYHLKLHMLQHRDPKAEKKFKCDECTYETNIKSYLCKHKLMKHSDPKAERKFKCDQCSYETDIKAYLREHNRVHKDTSEVEMHKCDNCEYEARQRANLKRHMLLKHSDPIAERRFKCDKCAYETNIKANLSNHNLGKHSDPEAGTKFKCDQCSYETNFKGRLRKHNLIHKDRSEVEMVKCNNCEYETRQKSNLIQHMLLKHHDPKAEKKFKCDECSYETNIKCHLRKHNLIHKDKSEAQMPGSVILKRGINKV